MTRKLYNEDSNIRTFSARVLQCEPDKGNRYKVVLDRTAFFPEGGGQLSDTGKMYDLQSEFVVLDVQEKNEEIYHYIERKIEVGTCIEAHINWEERFDKMQQHTAEHIASGIIYSKYGFQNVGFHLNQEIVTMDYDGMITRTQADELEVEINRAVTANVPIVISYPTKEELQKIEYRSKMEIEGQVRIVEIQGYDICACCAPHVTTTGEVGGVKLIGVESHRGGVRFTMVCGERAIKDYQNKSNSVKNLSVKLSVKENEVVSAVDKLMEELQAVKHHVWMLQNSLVSIKLAQIEVNQSDSLEQANIAVFETELDMDHRRDLMNQLIAKDCNIVGVFAEIGIEEYQYILGSKNQDVREIGKKLNEKCSGRGGGKSNMIQGNLRCTKKEIEVFWEHLNSKINS